MSLTSAFWPWVNSRLRDFNRSTWYSFISALVLLFYLLLYGIYRVIYSRWRATITSFLVRRLVYPYFFPRMPFVGAATRLQVLTAFLFLLANTLLTTIGSRSTTSSRAATMSVINLVPLFCGPRLSMVTKLLGISLRGSVGVHQWIGRTAIAQMLLHVLLLLTGSASFKWTVTTVAGIVVRFASLDPGCTDTWQRRVPPSR
jgi:hypothetical protein